MFPKSVKREGSQRFNKITGVFGYYELDRYRSGYSHIGAVSKIIEKAICISKSKHVDWGCLKLFLRHQGLNYKIRGSLLPVPRGSQKQISCSRTHPTVRLQKELILQRHCSRYVFTRTRKHPTRASIALKGDACQPFNVSIGSKAAGRQEPPTVWQNGKPSVQDFTKTQDINASSWNAAS